MAEESKSLPAARERLRVLLVGLTSADRAAVIAELARASLEAKTLSCDTLTECEAALPADVVLISESVSLPLAAEALSRAKVPAVLLAMRIRGDSDAFAAMDQGARDVIFRDQLNRLGHVLRRELRDRDRLRRAEEARQSVEASIHQILAAAPDAIGVHRDGRFVWVNARQAELFGYRAPAEMIGAGVFDSIVEPDRSAAAARIGRMRAEGEPAALREFHIVRTDGSSVHIEVSSLPFEFEGEPAILSFGRDVSERRRMQGELLQADRLAAVGKLAAGVAHEVNNPLAYVIANVGMVEEELPQIAADLGSLHDILPASGQARLGSALQRLHEARQALQEASEGAERVRVIVRDLKTFSRHDDISSGAVDVRRVIESSINMAWNEIRHRARLVKDFGKAPSIEANEGRLGQVFLNLLLYAAQSIPEGDRDRNVIRVATDTDARGRVVVTVSDSGAGIPRESLGSIFDPFFSARVGGKSPGASGLGLSLCHGIVQQLGGEISVESQPGEGTTFRVALPSRIERTILPREPQSSPGKPGGRARVLVVDDEPAVGSALRRMLGEHEVVLVGSGREAMRLMERDSGFDVVLCDLMMAEMTGMDVYDEVARSLPGVEARMIFMTGGVFTERAQEFLARVPNARLDKPFRTEELRALVQERSGAGARAA